MKSLEVINNMNIYEDYKVYRDRFGLSQPIIDDGRPYGVSGNGLIYTSAYILALVDNNAMTEEEKQRLLQVYLSCQHPNYPGLFFRTPGNNTNYNSYDDLLGVVLASKYLDNGLMAEDVYLHGLRKSFRIDESEGVDHSKVKLSRKIFPILNLFGNGVRNVWNTIKPLEFRIDTWLGRRLDVIAVIRMAANRPVGLFHWLYWAINMLGVYFQDRTSNHNAFILRYTMARAVDHYGFMTKLICKLFYKRFRSIWGSLAEVKVAYFNNPEHPDGIWLRNTK